jgi:N-acetylneuraminic acid mutarotase
MNTLQKLMLLKVLGGGGGAGITYGPEQTYPLHPYPPFSKDTYIQSNEYWQNYSTNNNLYTGQWNGGAPYDRTLIKFDLSPIPTNAVIISATLSLICSGAGGMAASSNAHVYRFKRAWTLDGVTWNTYDGAHNWQTAGAFGANDCEQTDIGSVAITAPPDTVVPYVINLTPAKVQEWVSGDFANNGFLLKMDEVNDDLSFAASNYVAAKKPKLTIVYKVPFGATSARAHTQLANVPIAADQAGVETCGSYIYFVGGKAAASHSAKVYQYDPAANTWAEKQDLPIATGLQSPILRAVGGKLYCIGGYNSTLNVWYDTVYQYDPGSDTWATKTSMPTGREDMGSAVIGNFIYVFGGLKNNGSNVGVRTKVLEIYDTVNDTWDTTKADMPDYKHLGDFGSVYNGKIYAIGGDNQFVTSVYPRLQPVNTVYEYDPVGNSWATKAVCPLPRCYCEYEVIGTKIYMVGGAIASTSEYTPTIYSYDPAGDVWAAVDVALGAPYAALGAGLAAYGGAIYMAGGDNGSKLNYFYRLTLGD